LHALIAAVSIRRPSERMSHFWTVQFFKNQISVFRTSLVVKLLNVIFWVNRFWCQLASGK